VSCVVVFAFVLFLLLLMCWYCLLCLLICWCVCFAGPFDYVRVWAATKLVGIIICLLLCWGLCDVLCPTCINLRVVKSHVDRFTMLCDHCVVSALNGVVLTLFCLAISDLFGLCMFWFLVCLYVCLVCWLVGCLVGWLVGWLSRWLVGWDWLVGWLVGRLVCWSVGRLVGWLVSLFVGWLVG
jgi:hypothetical protein